MGERRTEQGPRAYFLAAVLALEALAACGPPNQVKKSPSVDREWNVRLAQAGRLVEADMAEVGLLPNQWHPLVPFENLANEGERRFLSLPNSGLYVIEYSPADKAYIIKFLVGIGYHAILISLPTDQAEIIFTEPEPDTVKGPQVKVEWDLSQFVKDSPKASPSQARAPGFEIIKHNSPANYFGTLGAITKAQLRLLH